MKAKASRHKSDLVLINNLGNALEDYVNRYGKSATAAFVRGYLSTKRR